MFKRKNNNTPVAEKGRFPKDFQDVINFRLVHEEEGKDKCDSVLLRFNFLDENMDICASSQEKFKDNSDRRCLI